MCSKYEAEDISIVVKDVKKYFEIYEKPSHRLLQTLVRGKRQFFRPFMALDGVSFSVKRGECVGIIGRNGAGKSTLLQIITGTLAPSHGSVELSGRVAALLELGSGFNPDFTGRENVYLNASILGLTQKEIDSRYQDIINFADIGDFIDQPTKSYSSGLVVRLAFAVIAHVDADVLIVDEALAVGDAFFTQKCMRFLRNFIKTKTLIFVSHDVAAVNSLCTRAILLDHGRIKCEGHPKDVTEVYLEDTDVSLQGPSEKAHRTGFQKNSLVLRPSEEAFRDARQDIINASTLRNDIQIFQFNESGAAFGKGGVTIENVLLIDENDNPLSWIVGGEMVCLRVICRAHQDVVSPIVGFHLKDRLGQSLFGDNTFISYMDAPLHVADGEVFCADFNFRMPVLAAGTYSFATAIAEGTQEDHVQHQWRHDALILTSVSTSASAGIMGIPMRSVNLHVIKQSS